jgi:hypothetical protein
VFPVGTNEIKSSVKVMIESPYELNTERYRQGAQSRSNFPPAFNEFDTMTKCWNYNTKMAIMTIKCFFQPAGTMMMILACCCIII